MEEYIHMSKFKEIDVLVSRKPTQRQISTASSLAHSEHGESRGEKAKEMFFILPKRHLGL